MKLLTALQHGRTFWGILDSDEVVDLSSIFASPAALVAGSMEEGRLESAMAAVSARYALADVDLLAPVPSPGKILCVGKNYADHVAEMGTPADKPEHPLLFTRFPDSLVGDGDDVVRPAESEHFDYEGELAVVIGRAARSVSLDDALSYVAGYACFQDGSVRDYQRHTTQFTPGKNFERSGSWGPWIATADEVGDPTDLRLTTTVSGEVLQDASTSQLIKTLPEIISYCSSFTTLRPGDVIATGTPGGVGAARTPPRWLVPGDEVIVEIERVGRLANPIISA